MSPHVENPEGNKKYPKLLKTAGPILILLDSEWVQLHLMVDFELAVLLCYSHEGAKRPKFQIPLTNCSVSFKPTELTTYSKSLKSPLSFELTIDRSEIQTLAPISPSSPGKSHHHHVHLSTYSFRTFTLLQLWEWTTCFLSVGNESDENATIASSKRFRWKMGELDFLEECLEMVVEKVRGNEERRTAINIPILTS